MFPVEIIACFFDPVHNHYCIVGEERRGSTQAARRGRERGRGRGRERERERERREREEEGRGEREREREREEREIHKQVMV